MTRLVLTREERTALGFCLRHRLLEQDVVALPHRLHRRLEVKIVGQRDEQDVGELPVPPRLEHLVVVAEAAFGGDVPGVAHAVAPVGVDIRHGNDPQRAGKQLAVGGIFVAARARAHDGDGQFSGEVRLQRLDRGELGEFGFNVHDSRSTVA